jgi:YD repeat-containing protein
MDSRRAAVGLVTEEHLTRAGIERFELETIRNVRIGERVLTRLLLLVLLCSGLLLAVDGSTAGAYDFNAPLVTQVGPEELVFDHTTQACQPDDIPDTPARAFRDSLGRVQLLASHYHTWRAVGTTLGSVTHQSCSDPPVFGSHSDFDPSHYNDLEWIHSVYTEDGQKVYAFVHNEFHGWDVDEQCAALLGTPDINKCWYNAITLATSTNSGDSYSHAAPPTHLIASVPYQYAALQGPYGVYRPSNLIKKDGYYYMLAVVEPHDAQKAGICAMRTQHLDDPKSWRAFDGGGFTVRFMNPYVETGENPADHVCEPVSSANNGPLRGLEPYGVVYSTYFEKYLLWGAAMKDPTGKIAGFYFSLSDDLVNWTEPTLLMKAEIPLVSHQCGDPDPVRDASLLDPSSTTRNFETVGRDPYLYMTRFNYFYDNSGNCSLTLDRDLIRIPIEFTSTNKYPTASFTASPSPALTGQAVTFDASVSSDLDGTIANYLWDVDGDGFYDLDTGTSPTFGHAYPAAGRYRVKLRVTDSSGASIDTSRTITVTQPPVVSFTVTPNPVSTGDAATFDASASSDPDGAIAKYEWDLDGDGTFESDTGSIPSVTRSYPTARTLTAKLRVTDDQDASAEASQTVTVSNRLPTASFTVTPTPALTGEVVTFDGSASSDPDGTIANYKWDLDGNGTFETDTGGTAITTRSYATAATMVVKLRVTDANGATNDTTRNLTINPSANQPPTASFTVTPTPALTGEVVTFDGSASSDPDGTIANYKWDLDGNGTFETDTGSVSSVTNSYPTARSITVNLRVTDNGSSSGDASHAVTIQTKSPTASFTITPDSLPTGELVAFDGLASIDPDGTIAKYEWDLDGDGTFETDTGTTGTTSRTYSTATVLTIKLRVTDNDGASNETSGTLTVTNRLPTASFSASPASAAAGDVVSFDGSGSTDTDGTISKYEWDLDGNGSFETDTGAIPTAMTSYPMAVTLTVMLRVTDDKGGLAEASHSLTVNPPAPKPVTPLTTPPQAAFPPVAAGQPSSKLPSCATIRRQRSRLIGKRRAAKHNLAKAGTKAKKRRYKTQVRALDRKIRLLAKKRCST